MTSFKIKSLLGGLLVALAMMFAAPAMADSLDEARAAGLVGEQPDGYVGAVSASAPADIMSLIQAVNSQRMQKYQQIAAEKGVPAEQVAAITAEKLIAKLRPGWYYMDSSGQWVQK